MYENETTETIESIDNNDMQEDNPATSADDLEDAPVENPMQETAETVGDSFEDSSGIHDSDDGESGTGNNDLSAEDSGETTESDNTGIDGNADHSGSDSVVGDTVYNYYMELGTDYTDTLESLQASFDTLNETLFLILIFLLLSWTEKKIALAVRKFTVERRK